MKPILNILLILLLASTISYAQLLPVLGGQRAGISTAQFLKIGVGGRASALGESFVAIANDASALYWNPAGLVQFNEHQVYFSYTNWLVDIKHQFAGAVYKISDVDAVGVSFTTLHMDDMKVTTETHPFGTGEYFSFGDVAIGVSYAHKFTEQFSFGATVKYIHETLGKLYMNGFMVDLGTYYWTGLGTSRFAVAVSNFGNQIAPKGEVHQLNGKKVSEFQAFSPPTMFRIGFAIEPIMTDNHILTTSVQLNHPNDNSENVGIGLEYNFKNLFFIRGGYKLNVDEQNFTFGIGVNALISFAKTSFDYAYTNFNRLGSTHRFSILLGIY
jgi:long-subunit fatty acid transport protein